MLRRVTEAGHLLRLRGQIHDRVVDQIGDGERSAHLRRREVANRDADRLGARLRTQLVDHRLGQVDAVDRDSPLRQGQSDAPCPDAQLKGAAAVGQ